LELSDEVRAVRHRRGGAILPAYQRRRWLRTEKQRLGRGEREREREREREEFEFYFGKG
jgi:hypothetical protein